MNKLIKKLRDIPKGYFTLTDIKKISSMSSESLRVSMSRLAKNGEIHRVARGIYSADLARINWESFACETYQPSYISFESALAMHNVLSQKPVHITLATTNRSKRMTIRDKNIIYRHIQPHLFWGFEKSGSYLIADPEKALLDLIYLSLRGYAKFDYEENDLGFINKEKLDKYLKIFDISRMNDIVIAAYKTKKQDHS
jgi:predicted transcriptional regulator of viral defense system